MAIQNLLSLNFLVPFVAHKLDFSRAIRGLRGMPRRLLLVGHKLAAGNAAETTVMTVASERDAIAKFGEGSMLLAMWRAAKANAVLGLPIDCLAIPQPPDGAPQTWQINVDGPEGVTASDPIGVSGEVALYIGGVRVAVSVQAETTPAGIVAALKAAINAVPSLPVEATNGGYEFDGILSLQCKWKGVSGGHVDIRTLYQATDALPQGLTVVVTPQTSGTGVATMERNGANGANGMQALQGYRPTEIASGFSEQSELQTLVAELEQRWQYDNMQDGQLVVAVRAVDASSYEGYVGNSAQVHAVVTRADASSPWETAAMAGAIIESMASSDPAQPYTGAVLSGYYGPVAADIMTVDEQNNWLLAGMSPLASTAAGTGALSRMVTMHTKSDTAANADDASMRDLCWIKTMSYYRWYCVTEFQTKYQGFKLAAYLTDPIPGQKIMTPELGEEIMLGIYKLMQDAGLCQNMDYYKSTLVVEVDGPNGKLKIVDEPVLVTQHYQTEITSYAVAGAV